MLNMPKSASAQAYYTTVDDQCALVGCEAANQMLVTDRQTDISTDRQE